MKRSELVKIIQEEIDSALAERTDMEAEMGNPNKPADPTQAIKKMAEALGVRVDVKGNSVTFVQRSTVDEKTFEKMIQFIERIGYNVDMGRSDRYYESEPGERDFYPIIHFK